MQFQILAATSLLAMASASPCKPSTSGSSGSSSTNGTSSGTIGEVGNVFTLKAVSADVPEINGAAFNADHEYIFLNRPGNGSHCGSDYTAQFRKTDDSELWLYTDFPLQRLFAIRSAMGQGLFGYTTGVQPDPKNSERTGWEFDSDNNLSLKGAGFIACPDAVGGGWSVWVDAGITNPGGNHDCHPIKVQATTVAEPEKCMYS